MSKPITVALLGAGDRGMYNFGQFALNYPHLMRIVAVAEPDEGKRNLMAKRHNLSASQLFVSWEDLLDKPQMADALINATLDHLHYPSTIRALERGYHVLLEKPISNSPETVLALAEAARKSDRIVQICFELRYTPFFNTIKQLLNSGAIGDLVTIEHKENIIFWHMAHSFVRGNWRNSLETSPILLAKTCHDFDILVWMVQSPCKKVSSFGGLNYFRPEKAPPGAPDRCLDDCPYEKECPHSALKLYLGPNTDWPVSVISVDLSLAGRLNALRNGPYGRCVFKCDNNVLDNQSVLLEFENGVRVNFLLTGHSHENTRTVCYSGTRGILRGHFKKGKIEIINFNDNTRRVIHLSEEDTSHDHGGGDERLLFDFVEAVKNGYKHNLLSTIEESLESHLIIFAAEKARKDNQVVFLDNFKAACQQLIK